MTWNGRPLDKVPARPRFRVPPPPGPGAGMWFARLREHDPPHPTNNSRGTGGDAAMARCARDTTRGQRRRRACGGGSGEALHAARGHDARGGCQVLRCNKLQVKPKNVVTPARFERTTCPLGGQRSKLQNPYAIRVSEAFTSFRAKPGAKWVVTPARFERATCRLGGDRSIQLSYGVIQGQGYRTWPKRQQRKPSQRATKKG